MALNGLANAKSICGSNPDQSNESALHCSGRGWVYIKQSKQYWLKMTGEIF